MQTEKDGAIQSTSVISNRSAAETLAYDVTIPQGGRMTMVGSTVHVLDRDGDLVGAFLPPWARDANGKSVQTKYKINGKTLTQYVAHRRGGVSYPIVADPLYQYGIIKQVNYEKWSNGGYIVQLEVTTRARVLRLTDAALVIALGYKDLKSHFPRSMSAPTMYQQWACHVIGLYATFKIDLEGWRRSFPGWYSAAPGTAVRAAYKARNVTAVAKACNW